ncbi:MAG: hypothetical protein K6G22_14560 [Lachnospiraceae bacterium]|nr:hypothetical protein [Lachnospiraceae bacterium]
MNNKQKTTGYFFIFLIVAQCLACIPFIINTDLFYTVIKDNLYVSCALWICPFLFWFIFDRIVGSANTIVNYDWFSAYMITGFTLLLLWIERIHILREGDKFALCLGAGIWCVLALFAIFFFDIYQQMDGNHATAFHCGLNVSGGFLFGRIY